MPIHDGKTSARPQSIVYGARQARAIRNAMKGVRHEYEIDLTLRQRDEPVGVPQPKLAIGDAAFLEPRPRHLEERRIDIDGNHLPCDLSNLQREPAIARAEIDYVHSTLDADGSKHTGGIGP